MRQLTSLDAQFLALEGSRQSGHVAGLAILDPSTAPSPRWGTANVRDLMAERLPLLPPLRWRLQEVPLSLDYPYWIEDEHFELDYHVRELALPPPGNEEQLATQVARIVERPLDRARPLWELYVIHGLESGHVAMLTKIHHAVIDGVSGAEIMGLLLDLTPDGRELPEEEEDGGVNADDGGPPTRAEMLGRGLLGATKYPLRALQGIPKAIPNIEDTPLGVLPGAATLGAAAGRVQRTILRQPAPPPSAGVTAPRTSFNGRISPHRRFAFGQSSLDEVKAVKNAFGCTVNDVVVALCAGAVRRWLIEHDELLDEPLVAQVPVSVRTDDQAGTFGNRILLMAVPLFTDEADPVQRLLRGHAALSDYTFFKGNGTVR